MKLFYDDAVDYIESKGISCDPCSSYEGEYVCDMLDEDYDGYDDDMEEYYYTKKTLNNIIRVAKDYLKELEDEEDDEEDEG